MYIVGLCTGLLAAAAISSSHNKIESIPVTIEAILIAFRTELRLIEVRDRPTYGRVLPK